MYDEFICKGIGTEGVWCFSTKTIAIGKTKGFL